MLQPFLNIETFHIELKPQVLHALALWRDRPGNGFVDALLVAIAESPDMQLATFDKRLLRQTGSPYPWDADNLSE